MSNYTHKGKPVFVGHAHVRSVSEEKDRWKVEAYDYNYEIYRTYYLPTKKVKNPPKVGDYIRTYEIPTRIVGCDIGCNTVWDADLKKTFHTY